MNTFQIARRLVRASVASKIQYRGDFIGGLAGIVVLNAANLLVITMLVYRFHTLKGWTVWQLVFLYSLWVLCHSFYSVFFLNVSDLENQLVNGVFDQYLLRPVSPLLQFLGGEVQYLGFSDAFLGVIGITIVYIHLTLHWTLWDFAFLLMSILSGAIIEVSIALTLSSIAFWTVKSRATIYVMSQFESVIQEYPLNIFGKWFKIATTALLPVAFMNYYPALFLLHKNILGTDWEWLKFMSPVVAVVMLGIAGLVWRAGLSRYESTGS